MKQDKINEGWVNLRLYDIYQNEPFNIMTPTFGTYGILEAKQIMSKKFNGLGVEKFKVTKDFVLMYQKFNTAKYTTHNFIRFMLSPKKMFIKIKSGGRKLWIKLI